MNDTQQSAQGEQVTQLQDGDLLARIESKLRSPRTSAANLARLVSKRERLLGKVRRESSQQRENLTPRQAFLGTLDPERRSFWQALLT